MVSSIAFVLVSITSTVSDWSSTTYRSVWAAFSVILLGWPFTGSRAVTDGAQSAKDIDPGDHPPRFTTSISRSRMLDTYAVASKPLPFTTTQNGSSPAGGRPRPLRHRRGWRLPGHRAGHGTAADQPADRPAAADPAARRPVHRHTQRRVRRRGVLLRAARSHRVQRVDGAVALGPGRGNSRQRR